MSFNKTSEKIFAVLFAFGLILWIGSAIIRTGVAFDLYIPGSVLILKNWLTNEVQVNTVRLFANLALYQLIGFVLTFVATIVIAVLNKGNIKTRGWLFMSFVFVFLASGIEIVLLYLDLKLNLAFFNGQVKLFTDSAIQDYFVFRFTKMTIPAALALLSLISCVIVLVWQPLDKTKLIVEENIEPK
jgi:hypothetical protein